MANNYEQNKDTYLYTCPGCNKKFLRGDFFDYWYEPGTNRRWHGECHRRAEFERQRLNNPEEIREIQTLAKKYLGSDYDQFKVREQITEIAIKPGIKLTGIAATLRYWYEVKGADPSKANGGIGIVPHIYEDAKKYYKQKRIKDKKKAASVDTDGEHDNFLFERKKPTVMLKPTISYYGKNDKFDLE